MLRELAPGVDAAPRMPGRTGEPATAERGYLHCGPSGAGHFVKMVHNGIEYGLMAAYAEGFNVLAADAGRQTTRRRRRDGAAARSREFYQYASTSRRSPSSGGAAASWSRWLLDLTAAALPTRSRARRVRRARRGLGRGTLDLDAAIDEGVPTPVLTTALYSRFASRGRDDFAGKVLSAMRRQFGGHEEKKA